MSDKLTDLFCQLVRIDSPSGLEHEVSKFIFSKFNLLGLEVIQDSAGNLFITVPGQGQPVILSAHMDTVEPGRGIHPVIKEGIIRSSGDTILGADNKVALAAIIQAVSESFHHNHRALEIVFTVREETDGGISGFDFSRLKSRSGIIPDRGADLGSIVISSPWILNLNIKITGRAAHASLPEEAVNALTVTASALTRLRWGRLNPRTIANIGLISGGSAMNTIPGNVFLTGEIRSFSERDLKIASDHIRAVFQATTDRYGAILDYKPELYCQGYTYSRSDPEVKDLNRLYTSQHLQVNYEKIYGASDANVFIAHNIRVVTIGDGCKNPHTVQENIAVSDLIRLKDIILAYITRSY